MSHIKLVLDKHTCHHAALVSTPLEVSSRNEIENFTKFTASASCLVAKLKRIKSVYFTLFVPVVQRKGFVQFLNTSIKNSSTKLSTRPEPLTRRYVTRTRKLLASIYQSFHTSRTLDERDLVPCAKVVCNHIPCFHQL